MSDNPNKAKPQPGPAVKLHHQLAEGKQPNTGGSYAKGKKTPA